MNILDIILEYKFYLLFIIFYKVLTNAINLYQTKKLHNNYIYWLASNLNFNKIAQKKYLFKNLIKNANINDVRLPTTQLTGYGQLATFPASISENFPSRIEDFAKVTNTMFYEMEGIFKNRMYEAFNPLYWINLIIYLPKNLLEYFGLSSDNVGSKFLQLLWWLIGIAGTVLIELYPDYLRQLIGSYLPTLP